MGGKAAGPAKDGFKAKRLDKLSYAWSPFQRLIWQVEN